jgi:membrane protein DedA with SNARE-associated domain
MTLPPELANYIVHYGYLAVFSLIFLQEIGVPNPVPNEIILLFAGYLASTGVLNFFLILLVGISGDFLGTFVLYAIFYFFGEQILEHAPKWLPVKKIESIKQRISKREVLGIFLGRLLPYLRAYASIGSGLLKIPPKKFLLSVIASAIVWSGGYVLAGRLLGSRWSSFISKFSLWELLAIVAGIIILIFFIIPSVYKRFKKSNT